MTTSGQIQRQLWTLAGQSLNMAPTDSAPRLYVESLNEMFDSQSSRIYSLGNRVPTPVLVLEVAGAAIALAALALHLSTVGPRGVFTVMIAAGLVIVILLVTFDLDRPTRGLIRVPVSPLVQARAEMVPPPPRPHRATNLIRGHPPALLRHRGVRCIELRRRDDRGRRYGCHYPCDRMAGLAITRRTLAG